MVNLFTTQTYKVLLLVLVCASLLLFIVLRESLTVRNSLPFVNTFKFGSDNKKDLVPNEDPKMTIKNNTIVSRDYFQAINRGAYVRVGDLDVAIVTAVYYSDFPAKGGFNVFLNGWARHKSEMAFKCCFLNSLSSGKQNILEADASSYHVYSQWVVDMQNAEFSCSISKEQLTSLPVVVTGSAADTFRYVTFAQKDCAGASRKVLRIEHPRRVSESVGVCLKVSYGDLKPELIIEWFEFAKLIGVTKVFTFLASDLSDDARKVFLYYNATGFLDANDIDPAASKKGKARGFKHPRWNEQAYVDEVMAINDCKHRMAGLDFIVIQDIDEFIIPEVKDDSLYAILKKTMKKYPRAGALSFDSHVFMLNWGPSRKSPLHIMQFTNRTTISNYDGADRNTRWGFISDRTYFGQNNKVWPRRPYTSVSVPNDLYKLCHRRMCKEYWKDCLSESIRTRDDTIIRYEQPLLHSLKRLPLSSLLQNSCQYINRILDWHT